MWLWHANQARPRTEIEQSDSDEWSELELDVKQKGVHLCTVYLYAHVLCKKAVSAWLKCGMRLGLCKDIRLMIGKDLVRRKRAWLERALLDR